MPAPGQTPLQAAIADALDAAPEARDFYDRAYQRRTKKSGKPIYDIVRGESKRPQPETLRVIAEVMGLDTEHFVAVAYEGRVVAPSTRAVEVGHGRSSPEQPIPRTVDAGETVEITRLDLSLPMGPGATVDDYVEQEPLVFDASYIRSFTRTPPYRLRLAAGAGDSMFPTLVSNDLVWVDTTQNQLLHADRIYVASINGGAAIKRLRPVAGGTRILVISDNKMIEPYEVDANEVIIWGRVIRFARDL